ncbi:hypothetical protein DFH28DRAFT_1120400 [Melampsora americana]|nr:hypothetical protein DFH28DRAFT_1120400 [Melampsora americana]
MSPFTSSLTTQLIPTSHSSIQAEIINKNPIINSTSDFPHIKTNHYHLNPINPNSPLTNFTTDTDNNLNTLDPSHPHPHPHHQLLDLCNTHNGQSFDHVLEKLKQGMKAARGGGWVDINSDSGSELELTNHPLQKQIESGDEDENFTDSSSLSTRNQQCQSKADSSSPHHSFQGSPDSSQQQKHLQHIQPSSHSHHHIRHQVNEPLKTPTSPFGPITPPPGINFSQNQASPYVRHHFKWEYQANSTSPDSTISQPRLIETTSPQHSLDHQSTPNHRAWDDHQVPAKNFTIKHDSIRPSPSNVPSSAFTQESRLQSNNPHHAHRQVDHHSNAYSRWDIPSKTTLNHAASFDNSRSQVSQYSSNHLNSLKINKLPFGLSPGSKDLQSRSNSDTHPFDPTSISSVPFSLAPASPVRLSIPDGDPQLRLSPRKYSNLPKSDVDILERTRVVSPIRHTEESPIKEKSIADRERDLIRARLMVKSPYESFPPLHPRHPSEKIFSATAPAPIFPNQLSPTSPNGLPNMFHNMRLTSNPPTFPAPVTGAFQPQTLYNASPPQSAFSFPPPSTMLKPKASTTFVPPTVTTPLPGQVQPEEVRKTVKTQPPVVNTGNSGAMIPQPGDWMCMCGFVNWRRRKVCMRCFPFADGNDSVGAMMAMNAQRAAMLAADPLPMPVQNRRNPFDNSIPQNRLEKEEEAKKEWNSLELGNGGRRRSCSMGDPSPSLQHNVFGTGLGVGISLGDNSDLQQGTPNTSANSPGSSWQAIRALWQ